MSSMKEFEDLKIQLRDIISATNNFDNCIGRGGFGKVYKGELFHSKGQSTVTVKRLDRVFGQGNPEFWKEIMMLSFYRHENIVSLLGFCDENDEKILMYKYASKQSLDLYLNKDDLTWMRRLRICIGAARGLAYLHNPGEIQLRVLHRDIKSSNILLDENWNAMISDFGLSKFGPANHQFTFLVSNVVGTIGYCDPLYVEMGYLTKESDVYSFGVVLFEVLCGRLCTGNNERRPLSALVRECYQQNKINELIYANIKDQIDPNSLKAFTTIAYQCLKREREEQPLMTKIVRELETAVEYQSAHEERLLMTEIVGKRPLPFQPVVSPSAGAIAGRMATANPSKPHAAVVAGPPGLVQPPVAAAFLKHPRTSLGAPGLEYKMADSEHLTKCVRVGPSDEVSFSGSTHPPNIYSPDDIPKTVVRTLNQGSDVMCMDFHPQQQTILLVGTHVGEISIWEVGSRERMVHKPFKVWDISACSMPFQKTLVKDAAVSVNRCIWGPDGSILGVAFSRHIVQIYAYNIPSGELRQLIEIDAHVGGVNDIASAHPNKQLCIVTCGDDKTIKVWDAVAGRRQYTFEGHEAPVFSVCPHYKEQIQYFFSTALDGKIKVWLYDSLGSRVDYDAPGLWCTTMAYSADGTRLFSCGTSKSGESHLVEWNEGEGAIKKEYSGFRKPSVGVVQFDTTRNRFLAAGDEFQIKFWDMDSTNMLTVTGADDGLPACPRLRFNKEGSLLAVTTRHHGIKVLANSDGQRMLQMLESRVYDGT